MLITRTVGEYVVLRRPVLPLTERRETAAYELARCLRFSWLLAPSVGCDLWPFPLVALPPFPYIPECSSRARCASCLRLARRRAFFPESRTFRSQAGRSGVTV